MCYPKTDLIYNIHHPKHATCLKVISLNSIKLRYDFASYKTEKIKDIIISPHINKMKYNEMLNELKAFFKNKTFTVINDNGVYLYYDDICVNTMINNMIVYYIQEN